VKIGIDIDMVLADYVKGYNALAKAELGIDLPDPATTWEWDRDNGVTKEQANKLWAYIKTSMFWGSLLPMPGALEALESLNALTLQGHDVYFITSRPGHLAKFLSEMWLKFHGMDTPTVIIAHEKGPIAKGLDLDVFVDDKPENNKDVIDATGRYCVVPGGGLRTNIRAYLIDHPYNQWADQPFNYGERIANLNEVLDIEFPKEEKRAA
jgi:5'(3')-deoxyribonucleotidase